MTAARPMARPADPVARHIAELERALCGPARVRRSMIREVREGLHDAVTAYREGGLDQERAAALAVRDFGPIREVAPQFQEELAARQGRWTAALVVVLFPGMIMAWDLLWSSSTSGRDVEQPALLTSVLVHVQDAAASLVAAVAVVLLAASFHRTAPQRLVSSLVGVIACIGAVVTAGAAVLMNIADVPSAHAMIDSNPYVVPAFYLSGLAVVLVLWAAVRALWVARAR